MSVHHSVQPGGLTDVSVQSAEDAQLRLKCRLSSQHLCLRLFAFSQWSFLSKCSKVGLRIVRKLCLELSFGPHCRFV